MALLRWRWLIWALIMLTVCIVEVVGHFPNSFKDFSLDFLREIFIFGVALPWFILVFLTALARTKLRPVGVEGISIDKGHNKVKQRVLVVENDLLLGAGVESLLRREPNIDVIGISSRDEEELIKKIGCLQPAAVILDEASYLIHSIRLLAMLRKEHELRLVIVNADKNLVQVYHKQNILLTQISDLIKVLLEK